MQSHTLTSLLLVGFVVATIAQDGEVAFAGPPAAEVAASLAKDANLTCAAPCYTVTSRYPFKQCGPSCDPTVCNRGNGVFQTPDVCCEVSFPDGGCTQRPDQCWVVESYQVKTCVRDDRKCLQGFGVYPSEAACCAPQGPAPLASAPGAFPEGCGNVTKAAQPCWVVDTYWPTRQCRQSRTLCAQDSGVRSFANKASCCGPNGAFGQEGCSNTTIPVPCWVVDSYYPDRSCRRSSDVAVCNRGWGVFRNEEICCVPGASFAEGCTKRSTPAAGTEAGPAATTVPAAATGAGPATRAVPGAAAAAIPAAVAAAIPAAAAVAAGAVPPGVPQSAIPVVTVTTAPLPGSGAQAP